MRCNECQRDLSRYIDSELTSPRSEDVELHLKTCASCRETYRILAGIWELLDEIPGAEPDPYFYTHLRARIDGERAEYRRRGLERFIIPVSTAIALILGILIGSTVGMNGSAAVSEHSSDETWAEVLELDTLNDFPKTSVGDVLFASADRE